MTVGDWLVPLLLATLIVGVAGLLMYLIFLRWNQGQELRQALITIAISIIAADQMLAHFGGVAEDIKLPPSFDQALALHLYTITYGRFRLLVLVVAIVLGIALALTFRKTRYGMIVRAGVDDRAMVSALGVNIQLVFAATFFLGAALAGLGGVFGGTMVALGPGEDSSFLLNSLIVVIIGGMGSLMGAAVGSIALGLVQSYAQVYLVFGGTDYTFYAIVLDVRPAHRRPCHPTARALRSAGLMTANRAITWVSAAIAVLVLLILPLFTSGFFTSTVGIRALWLGIAAVSVTFLAGYGGMVLSRADGAVRHRWFHDGEPRCSRRRRGAHPSVRDRPRRQLDAVLGGRCRYRRSRRSSGSASARSPAARRGSTSSCSPSPSAS